MKDKFGGRTFLRFDDTNPSKEDTEYVDSIMEDIHWLGFEWDELRYASDYFERMYEAAEKLIREGKAYVCDLTPEQMREYRGTLTAPGRPSPYRDRSVEENLELFRGMRAGQYPDGSRVLRAKIDMASPNINMRDPVLYRIVRAHHPVSYTHLDVSKRQAKAIKRRFPLADMKFSSNMFFFCKTVKVKKGLQMMSKYDMFTKITNFIHELYIFEQYQHIIFTLYL